MKYKRLLRHLTIPSAYRLEGTILSRQYKADPPQNKVKESMPMGLSFFLFSMLIVILSSVIFSFAHKMSVFHSLLSIDL